MDPKSGEDIDNRTTHLFRKDLNVTYHRADRMFAGLMIIQWFVGIVFALLVSPKTWAGAMSQTHIHVYAAIFLGGIITGLPVFLALKQSGKAVTRHVIAAGQMLMSALLIHLTGGRIETHFHVFGSLAFLAFYRDWRILLTATVVVALDHGIRGVFLPQSVYGVLTIQPWRFMEHAGWVVFEDIVLVRSIFQSLADMRAVAGRQVQLEELNKNIEQKVIERTQQLTESNKKLDQSRQALLQSEKLSAVGQLAAGVAHEINNPLGVILGFAQTLKSVFRTNESAMGPLEFIEKETLRCKDLVQNLLVFSRKSNAELLEEVAINETAAETLGLIMTQGRIKNIQLVEEMDKNAPKVIANKGQIHQIILNLCNNAMDAMSSGGILTVKTGRTERNGEEWLTLQISDTGSGIPEEIQSKIFEPFFTTKDVGKGTGLGLSLVFELVQKHGGTIEVESEVGKGTTFTVCLPIQKETLQRAA